MGWVKLLVSLSILAACVSASAQSPIYGLGRIPSAEEIKAVDINIATDGKNLPPGSGTAKEGATLYVEKGCAVCHGPNGRGGKAPALVKSDTPTSRREIILTMVTPFPKTIWDYINRAMPLQKVPVMKLEPGEVYALTAYLFFKNGIIQENDVMDAQTLSQVKMPNRDGFVPPAIEGWKPGMQRRFTIIPDPAAK